MTEPTVDIVTPLWKGAEFIPALFEGLAALDYPHECVTMHFVENGPGDGSLDEVKRQMERFAGRLPPIKIHQPGMNTGFAGGNNLVMRESIAQGVKYVYLLNNDATFESQALREAVAVAERDSSIGSVQSLIVLQQNPEEVNASGNAIHYLGMGYCLDYHRKRSEILSEVKSIAYASGAGVLFPVRVLKEVGLLDEVLWLYHEDLDLGWRLRLAGYQNVVAPKSVVRHHYNFSRSTSKWYWMERNRIAVMLKNYRLGTLLVLLPQLIILDVALFLFALKGGWWREKVKASVWFLRPSTWAYLSRGRRDIARIRRVSDREILKNFTPVVAYQEFESPFIVKCVNPAWKFLFTCVKLVVVW